MVFRDVKGLGIVVLFSAFLAPLARFVEKRGFSAVPLFFSASPRIFNVIHRAFFQTLTRFDSLRFFPGSKPGQISETRYHLGALMGSTLKHIPQLSFSQKYVLNFCQNMVHSLFKAKMINRVSGSLILDPFKKVAPDLAPFVSAL